MEEVASAAVEQVALAPDGEHLPQIAASRKVGRGVTPTQKTGLGGLGSKCRLALLPAPPPAGLPVAALWDALAEAAAEEGVELGAPAVRTALWRRLTSEPGIRAALPPRCAPAEAEGRAG